MHNPHDLKVSSREGNPKREDAISSKGVAGMRVLVHDPGHFEGKGPHHIRRIAHDVDG